MFVPRWESSVYRGRAPAASVRVSRLNGVRPTPELGEPSDFTATAYCLGGVTATGTRPADGIVAADPAVLPMGSTIRVDGLHKRYNGLYRVMDTGSGVRAVRSTCTFGLPRGREVRPAQGEGFCRQGIVGAGIIDDVRNLRIAVSALLAGCAVCATACGAGAPPRLVERARLAMGSQLRLTAWTIDEPATQAAFDAVFAEFDRLEALMSTWRPDTDVVRINAAAGDHAVAVDPDVRDILHIANQVSEWTGGTFDVTFGALTDVWKFDQDQDNSIQARSDSGAAGADRLSGDRDRRSRRDGFFEAQGHAHQSWRDREGLRSRPGGRDPSAAGLRDFMIQAGGDMYVAGRRGDRLWRLGIADPRGSHDPFATVELADGTFSTSGDYERAFVRNGRRYHHILDPRTGEPARESRSVTLVTAAR